MDTIFSLASEENAPLYLGNLPWVTRTGDLVISIVYREAVYILQISEDRGSAEIGGYSGARNLTIGAYASPKQLASLIQRWDRVHKRLMES
ncbi:hypothetical protein [Streptomyces tsukubensis]|uniref:hypothetical protein n=1 Tax=Streptomyces tsukubensis TaxID=83656 RepID=UPI00344E88A2